MDLIISQMSIDEKWLLSSNMDVRVKNFGYRKELYNPYRSYTREEIIEQLEIARKHAYEGKVMDAKQASFNIREKYGL